MPGRLESGGSSRKRPRNVTINGVEEEVLEVREASSNLRGDTRKRVRVSDAGPSKDSRRRTREATTSSDEEDDREIASGDEMDGVERERLPSSPPRTQYDELRDGDFTHLQHEMEDDQRATQRLRFQPNRLGDNAVADNGIIESITCINFMCHTRLHCELGPLLNFIVGENGSGKSAILTAITLCLGGKASSTNRGGSLKNFVKEGQEKAILTVKLKNQGIDAFNHDLYGDSIIIERHFSKSGSSGFKVISAAGKTISTKRQEIEEIVEYFALQVDNPLNVLSQDNARQFLNAATKTQKYKFFIEGVQLQQLDNDYRLIKESLDQTMAKVPDLEALFKETEAALAEAKRKKEAITGSSGLRLQLRVFGNQLVWKQVEVQEKELEVRQQKLAEIERNIENAGNLEVQRRTELLDWERKIEDVERSIEEAKEIQETLKSAVDDAVKVRETKKQRLNEILADEREAKTKLTNTSNLIKNLQERIEEEENRLAQKNGEAHSKATQELEAAIAEEKDLSARIKESKAQDAEFERDCTAAKARLDAKKAEFEQQRANVSAVEDRIKSLQSGVPPKWEPYDANMPKLVEMIERETRFRNKPIGPLGLHIRLNEARWSSILETILGADLNGFIVTNHEDNKLLKELMKRAQVRNSPILQPRLREPLNLQGKEPDDEFLTILRVLKIDNVMVRDHLIISKNIEQVVLVPDRIQGEDILFSGARPRNVKNVITFHDKGPMKGGLRLSGGNGAASTDPIRMIRGQKPRMTADISGLIAVEKEQLDAVNVDFHRVLREKNAVQGEYDRCKRLETAHKGERASLMKRLTVAEKRVRKAQVDLDKFEGEDGTLQVLLNELEEKKNEEQSQGLQFGTIANLKSDANKEAEEAQRAIMAAKKECKDADAKVTKLEERRKRWKEAHHIALVGVNDAVATRTELEELKETWIGKIQRQEAYVQEITQQAVGACPTRVPIPEGETVSSLDKKCSALQDRIEKEKKKHGMTEDQANDLVLKRSRERNKAADDLKGVIAINQQLKQTLGLRLHRWRLFQRFISAQSRCNFQYLLAERGFRGKLLFDHQRKALDLQVEPDKTEKRANGRSTKTLSGGEKSFSSICLLLSIWEAMGSPLRCLDEFDVFMDNVNRAISTNMLITAARRSVNRQYIFITPNAIEGRNTLDKDVKIIRLTDPRQQRLADF